METTDSTPGEAAPAAPRRRGAPIGNRNAWKHGRRSAAAKAGREAASTRLIERLPDPDLFVRIAKHSQPELEILGWDKALAPIGSNKTNNSSAPRKEGGGTPPSDFPTNKTNNSAAREGPQKRGAPKGNRNALKHGFRSRKRREFSSGLRDFVRRLDVICALARAMAEADVRSRP